MKGKHTKIKQVKRSYLKISSSTLVFILKAIMLIALPTILFGLIRFLVLSAPKSGWVVLGFIGSLIIGIGLISTIIKRGNSKIKKNFLLSCLTIGTLLIAIGELLEYHAHLFSIDIVSYYFTTLSFYTFWAVFYPAFRLLGIHSFLRKEKKLSKTHIKKLMIGKRNFWWYENIHKEFNIGVFYYLNKVYTILFLFCFSLHLIFGLFRKVSLVICPLSVILYLLSAVLFEFSWIRLRIDQYGQPFILLRRDHTHNHKIDSSIFDLIMFGVFIAMIYTQIILTITLWQ